MSNTLIERGFMMLEDHEYEKADELFEQALNIDPKNAQGYLGKLCSKVKISDYHNYYSIIKNHVSDMIVERKKDREVVEFNKIDYIRNHCKEIAFLSDYSIKFGFPSFSDKYDSKVSSIEELLQSNLCELYFEEDMNYRRYVKYCDHNIFIEIENKIKEDLLNQLNIEKENDQKYLDTNTFDTYKKALDALLVSISEDINKAIITRKEEIEKYNTQGFASTKEEYEKQLNEYNREYKRLMPLKEEKLKQLHELNVEKQKLEKKASSILGKSAKQKLEEVNRQMKTVEEELKSIKLPKEPRNIVEDFEEEEFEYNDVVLNVLDDKNIPYHYPYSYFGEYYSSNSEKKEPIKWLCVDEKEDAVLFVCENVIETMPYNIYEEDGWANSSLRRWLNNEFIYELLKYKQIKYIKETTLLNESNPRYNVKSASYSDDYVFILSMQEVEKYFYSKANKRANATRHAKNKKVQMQEGKAIYWTRNYGHDKKCTADINGYGANGCFGYISRDKYVGVRPAMWVKVK